MEEVIADKLKSVLNDFEVGEYPLEMEGKKVIIKVYDNSQENIDLNNSKVLAFKNENRDEYDEELRQAYLAIENDRKELNADWDKITGEGWD